MLAKGTRRARARAPVYECTSQRQSANGQVEERARTLHGTKSTGLVVGHVAFQAGRIIHTLVSLHLGYLRSYVHYIHITATYSRYGITLLLSFSFFFCITSFYALFRSLASSLSLILSFTHTHTQTHTQFFFHTMCTFASCFANRSSRRQFQLGPQWLYVYVSRGNLAARLTLRRYSRPKLDRLSIAIARAARYLVQRYRYFYTELLSLSLRSSIPGEIHLFFLVFCFGKT